MLDILVIVIYFVLLVLIGWWASRDVSDNEDALAGGKGFGITTAAVGRTANMAGGPATVGNTTYGFESGLGGSWFAIANMISMWVAAPFAPRMYRALKRGRSITIGGYLGHRFGRFSRIFAGLTNFFTYAGFVASNLLATGTILNAILDFNFTTSMIITTIIVIVYTMSGGLKSVYQVNVIQIAIMIIGFAFILLPISLNTVGGFSNLIEQVPNNFLDFSTLGWAHIIGVILIPTAVTGFTTQAGYISIASSKNLTTSWKSSLVAGVFYAFIVVPVILIGMAVFLQFPDSNAQNALATAVTEFLPTGLVGVLVASIISATMSTAAACSLNAVTCFTQDVLAPIKDMRAEKSSDKEVDAKATAQEASGNLTLTRVLITVVILMGLGFATLWPNVIQLILMGYSLAVGGLLVPVFATMFWKRATKQGVMWSMIGGALTYLLLEAVTPFPVLFLSMAVSLVLMVAVSLMTEKQHPREYMAYFEDTWAEYATEEEKEEFAASTS